MLVNFTSDLRLAALRESDCALPMVASGAGGGQRVRSCSWHEVKGLSERDGVETLRRRESRGLALSQMQR